MLRTLAVCALSISIVVSAAESARTVEVTGDAEVTAEPDTAEIEFSVEVRERSLEKADTQFRKQLDSVQEALGKLGLPGDAVRSSDTRVRTMRGYDRATLKDLGVSIRKDFVVGLTDLSAVRRVLDALLGAGVGEVDGVSYRSSRQTEIEAETLALAGEKARVKADAVARKLGAGLGKVLSIREAPGYIASGDDFEEFADDDDDDFGEGDGFESFGLGDVADFPSIRDGRIRVYGEVRVVFELMSP